MKPEIFHIGHVAQPLHNFFAVPIWSLFKRTLFAAPISVPKYETLPDTEMKRRTQIAQFLASRVCRLAIGIVMNLAISAQFGCQILCA